jgi:uncharacterized BrkB/YihY/UPF0761 family membrane protein
VGLVVALWSANAGAKAVMDALNVYQQRPKGEVPEQIKP